VPCFQLANLLAKNMAARARKELLAAVRSAQALLALTTSKIYICTSIVYLSYTISGSYRKAQVTVSTAYGSGSNVSMLVDP
jgi:hypothetical protein